MDTLTTRGFHFAATTEYAAEFVEAATIQEAEEIYMKIRRSFAAQPAEPEDLPLND